VNVVLLSPHFPPQLRHYAMRLRQAGATVLGIADEAWEALHPDLRAALTEYYRVPDMHDEDALVRAMGWLIHRHGRIDRLESLNEYWLETDARLRTAFDIPGIRLAAVGRVKRKSAMKRVFERAGAIVPRGRICRTPREARRLAAELGFPIIAKPDVGVGAAATYRLDDEAALEAHLASKPPGDYLYEEAIEGAIETYDGIADREGSVVFDVTMSYGLPVIEAVAGGDMYYWIDRTIPADLVDVGRRVLRAFDVRERPFHFEFFRRPDGALVALEVNMRQPGGITVDMWNIANSIDCYRAWADVVTTGRAELQPTRANVCMYVGRKRGRAYLRSHEEVVALAGPRFAHHERIDDVFAPAIGNEGYLLLDPDRAPLVELARAIHEIRT
jgi:hypothetical protein